MEPEQYMKEILNHADETLNNAHELELCLIKDKKTRRKDAGCYQMLHEFITEDLGSVIPPDMEVWRLRSILQKALADKE